MFTMVKSYTTQTLVLPEGLQVFRGVYWNPCFLLHSCMGIQ